MLTLTDKDYKVLTFSGGEQHVELTAEIGDGSLPININEARSTHYILSKTWCCCG